MQLQFFIFCFNILIQYIKLIVSWTLYLLSLYPEIQEKVQKEIDQILSPEIEITFEEINKLEFLFQCIQESLRLFPPQPAFVRKAIQDNVIGSFKIPKGVKKKKNEND